MNCKVKYSKELLQEAVRESISIAGVIRKLSLKHAGGNYSHIKSRIIKYGIDTSHFLGVRANSGQSHKGGPGKLDCSSILIYNRLNGRKESTKRLKRALLESGIEEKCSCGLDKMWNGKPLVLQIDHIDGDWLNNCKENLRFLCPNCHSQTETYGSKNQT